MYRLNKGKCAKVYIGVTVFYFVILPARADCLNYNLFSENSMQLLIKNECSDVVKYNYCVNLNNDSGNSLVAENNKIASMGAEEKITLSNSISKLRKFRIRFCLGLECAPEKINCELN